MFIEVFKYTYQSFTIEIFDIIRTKKITSRKKRILSTWGTKQQKCTEHVSGDAYAIISFHLFFKETFSNQKFAFVWTLALLLGYVLFVTSVKTVRLSLLFASSVTGQINYTVSKLLQKYLVLFNFIQKNPRRHVELQISTYLRKWKNTRIFLPKRAAQMQWKEQWEI